MKINARALKGKEEMIISYRTTKWKLIIDYEKNQKNDMTLLKILAKKNNLYDENNRMAKTYKDTLLETAQVKKGNREIYGRLTLLL